MTGKERAKYRAAANGLEPVFQIGKGGVTDALLAQVESALDARELIKIKALLETIPESPKEMAQQIAAATKADVIQVIGGCIVLYRENLELRQAEKEKEKRKKETAKKQREKERTAANRGKRIQKPAPRGTKR